MLYKYKTNEISLLIICIRSFWQCEFSVKERNSAIFVVNQMKHLCLTLSIKWVQNQQQRYVASRAGTPEPYDPMDPEGIYEYPVIADDPFNEGEVKFISIKTHGFGIGFWPIEIT